MSTSLAEVKSIFCKAMELCSSAERAAYLDEACRDNPQMRAEVEALMQAQPEAGAFFKAVKLPAGVTVDYVPLTEGPGAVIGPYKLLQQIGEGGMGTVFMAEQTKPVHRKVALKIIKAGMDNRQFIARFEAERQALAMMDHVNIARVFDGGTIPTPSPLGGEGRGEGEGRPYFVMELVHGVPITKYCDDNHLTPRERLELFVPVCQAIQHAHQKGIIHRDIKPSNVMVTLYDGKPVPKVIDFGVAKATEQKLTERTLFTQYGTMVGTLEYMSPEQAEMSGLGVDTRSDIYSLGVLLYELLTGSTPLTHKRMKEAAYAEILRLIKEEEPQKPSTRLSDSGEALASISAQRHMEPAKLTKLVRGELDWIVMKALEKDRNRRYETANGFAADVQRYLNDEQVLACPPSAGYRLRKFMRRNKAGLALAGLILFFIALVSGGAGWMVRNRAARQSEAALRVGESLARARGLIGEDKLALARAELAEGKGRIGNDRAALASLAAEIETLEEEVQAREAMARAVGAELEKYRGFLALIDQAHEAETSPAMVFVLQGETSESGQSALQGRGGQDRDPAQAVPFLIQALSRYKVLEHEDWSSELSVGLLGSDQVRQVRRKAYEELLWLADDIARRQEDHRTGRQISAESAARQGLAYLQRAEAGHAPTSAFYRVRARCRQASQDKEAAQTDEQQARQIPATIALDHYLLGQDAQLAKRKTEAVKQFEAALRLEPTHYWSLMRLGFSLREPSKHDQDSVAAVAAFTGCIMKRPDHAHAYLCRGETDFSLGRYQEALADCNKALELKPDLAIAWSIRGRVYGNLRQYDKALADCNKALELKPDLVFAWCSRGAVYCDHVRQYDKALADFNKALELKPDDASARYCRGLVYTHLRQYDKALADFNKALEVEPDLAVAWAERGRVYADLGQYDKALGDFNKALELKPDHVTGWINRGRAYAELRRYDQAVADYSKALELNPDSVTAWHNRGNSYTQLRQYDKAVADYSKALQLNPDFTKDWHNRGRVYSKLQQYDKALADYSKALERNPDDSAVRVDRGVVYFELRQYDKAVADYSKALEVNPNMVEAWNNRGNVYAQLRQYDKALPDLNKALELKPDHVTAWMIRGYVHSQLGQYDKALVDYSKCLELNPDYASASHGRGNVYYRLGQYDKALADWTKLIEREPGNTEGWNRVAWLLVNCPDVKLRDPGRAAEMAKKAVALTPKNGTYWLTLGWAYYRAENWKAAQEAAEKARPLRNGGDCADWFLLAMIHWRLGDKEKARQWYDRANQWMDKHSHEDWPRFRAEAVALLGLSEPPAPPKEEKKLPPKK